MRKNQNLGDTHIKPATTQDENEAKSEETKSSRQDTHKKKTMILGCVGATMVVTITNTNSQLNTNKYISSNQAGFSTGHGYAFEDLVAQLLRRTGHKIDQTIGKNCTKNGPDIRVDDKYFIQCKCYRSPEEAAKNIAKHGGYIGQEIYVNKEAYIPIKQILKKMETEGQVPSGTTARLVNSNITYDKAKNTASFFTKDSLYFDATTATPIFVTAFLAATIAVVAIGLLDKKKFSKELLMIGLGAGLLTGLFAGGVHILLNQYKRIK